MPPSDHAPLPTPPYFIQKRKIKAKSMGKEIFPLQATHGTLLPLHLFLLVSLPLSVLNGAFRLLASGIEACVFTKQ